jgi:hypothetical protein
MTLRPELGATSPSWQSRWINEDGTPTLDFARAFERVLAMVGNDETRHLAMGEASSRGRISELEERLELVLSQAALTNVDGRLSDIEERLQLLLTESAQAQIERPRGALASQDEVLRDYIASGELGRLSIGSDNSTPWVKASIATPSKQAADYRTHTIETGTFRPIAGSRLRVVVSYKNRSVKDAFEHFTWKEKVALQYLDGSWTDYSTLDETLLVMGSSANINAVPSGMGATEDVNFLSTRVLFANISAPLNSNLDNDCRVQLTLTPDGAASAGTECIAGGTFNASDVKTYFALNDASVSIEQIPPGPTEFD